MRVGWGEGQQNQIASPHDQVLLQKKMVRLAAWPDTTFLTLHRQEAKGRVRGWFLRSEVYRAHGRREEEQPIYPDL